MHILVIGSGGREHCLAWALAKSPAVDTLFSAPGNAGIARIAQTAALSLEPPFNEVIDFVREKGIGLVVVGPEAPLTAGIADGLSEAGIRVFGPSGQAARMEGSKAFAKEIMQAAGVPTGAATLCRSLDEALGHLESAAFPLALKYDALAAGKGVTIHPDRADAERQLRAIFADNVFGDPSVGVLVEEFLQGPEVSVMALVDGRNIVPMIAAQDHKPAGEGDTGLNTGGMGAYAPAPLVTPELSEFIMDRILRPTVEELGRRGIAYQGVLYAGLMITSDGPKVIEYNCRFGDPETQVLLPLLENDLLDVINAVIDGRLDTVTLRWKPGYAVSVVGAAPGYPGDYPKGLVLQGLDHFTPTQDRLLFHAGTTEINGRTVTNGGRVLNAVALAGDLESARAGCHAILESVHFPGMWFRRDIAFRAIGN